MGITAGSERNETDLKTALFHDFAARGSAPKAMPSMPESAESRRRDLGMGDESSCRPLPRTLSSAADIGPKFPLSPERAATPRSSPWVQASSVQRDAGTLGMGRKQTLSPERTLSHETPPPIRLDQPDSGLVSSSADDPGLRRSSLRSTPRLGWVTRVAPSDSWGSAPGVKRTKRTSRQPCSKISLLEGVLRKPCSRCPKVRNPGAETSIWVTNQAVAPCHGRCQAWRIFGPTFP